jgi:hypothetical protein
MLVSTFRFELVLLEPCMKDKQYKLQTLKELKLAWGKYFEHY